MLLRCVARPPSDIDLSCGFHASRSSGSRSSNRRVEPISWSKSASSASLIAMTIVYPPRRRHEHTETGRATETQRHRDTGLVCACFAQPATAPATAIHSDRARTPSSLCLRVSAANPGLCPLYCLRRRGVSSCAGSVAAAARGADRRHDRDRRTACAGARGPRHVGRAAHLRRKRRRPVRGAGFRPGAGPAVPDGSVAPIGAGAVVRGPRAELHRARCDDAPHAVPRRSRRRMGKLRRRRQGDCRGVRARHQRLGRAGARSGGPRSSCSPAGSPKHGRPRIC